MTTIDIAEQEMIATFNELEDWFLQYEYLLEMTAFMPALKAAAKTDANRVPGCQSNVWLVLEYAAGRIEVKAFSDSLLIRGILALIVSLINGRTPAEITTWNMRLLNDTALKEQLAHDRFKGMDAVAARIKAFAASII